MHELEHSGAVPMGVVLVDDDPDQLQLCGLALARVVGAGLQVRSFSSPQDALEALGAQPASLDLLVVDLQMPGLPGVELVSRLRRLGGDWQTRAIVMVSSSDLATDRLAAVQAGADAYIVKPTGAGGWVTLAQRLLSTWQKVADTRAAGLH